MRNAKLSEYRFLKILHGFAMNQTAKELAPEIRISEKTIRAIYRQLRDRLPEAIMMNPQGFGGAGYHLLPDRRLGVKGKRFLATIARSGIYARHAERHAPRLSDMRGMGDLLFEVAVRMLCNTSLRQGAMIDYAPDTKAALREASQIADWIRENRHKEGFLERQGRLIRRFEEIAEGMKRILDHEALAVLRTQAREHRYSAELLYSDLRRYLLKHPLDGMT